MKKKYIYHLTHIKHLGFEDGTPVCDCKMLGYFSTRHKAEKAIKKYDGVVGFRDYPDGFKIERFKLDADDIDQSEE